MSASSTATVRVSNVVGLTGRTFFPIAFLARLPFAIMVVGVLTLIVSARGSVALGGLGSAAVGIGAAVGGPLSGAAADRFGQRPVLLGAALGNGLAMTALVLIVTRPVPDTLVLVVALLVGASAPQASPMSRSRLVGIITGRLPAEQRVRLLDGVMAYESAADETVFILGPLVVGVLSVLVGPGVALLAAAVLTVLGVGAFALHPSAVLDRGGDPVAPAPARALLAPRVVVVVLGAIAVGTVFGSLLTSLEAFLGERGHADAVGLVYGAFGVGSTVLALAAAFFPARFSMPARWICFAGIATLGAVAYGGADRFATTLAAMVVMGIGIGPALVSMFRLATDRSPAGRSATVMTAMGSGIIVGQSLSAALVGAAAEARGASLATWMPAVATAALLVVGVLGLLCRRR